MLFGPYSINSSILDCEKGSVDILSPNTQGLVFEVLRSLFRVLHTNIDAWTVMETFEHVVKDIWVTF